MAVGTNFSYTFNNYTDDDQQRLQTIATLYHVYGRETGVSGTPHLQGTICWTKSKRLASVQKILKGAHVEITRNKEASIAYSKKDGDFWEQGAPPRKSGGKASDDITYDLVFQKESWDDVLKIPNIACKLSWAREIWRSKRSKAEIQGLPDELFEWQKQEVHALHLQTDRQIRFLVDYEGGQGKTVLAKHLVQCHGAFYTRGGKHADIAYAFDNQKIVVFDLSRTQEEAHWPYSIMENMKDGMLFSGKYESMTKTFASCKVLVLCNEYPDKTKLSADRWDIKEFIQQKK